MTQPCLFDLTQPPVADMPRRANARTAKKELIVLENRLFSAQCSREDAEGNIGEILLHWNASESQIVDDNWWDGGIRFGVLDGEFWTPRTDGRYPIRARRNMRHLLVMCHEQRRDALYDIANLEPKVQALGALVGNDREAA